MMMTLLMTITYVIVIFYIRELYKKLYSLQIDLPSFSIQLNILIGKDDRSYTINNKIYIEKSIKEKTLLYYAIVLHEYFHLIKKRYINYNIFFLFGIFHTLFYCVGISILIYDYLTEIKTNEKVCFFLKDDINLHNFKLVYSIQEKIYLYTYINIITLWHITYSLFHILILKLII